MPLPTPTEVRAFLEGYGIDSAKLSDKWIEDRITGFIVPYVERVTRQSFNAVASVTEYYSGNGSNILILNRRPIVAITAISYVLGSNVQGFIDLTRVEQINSEGVIKSKANYDETYMLPVFAKGKRNLKITYTYGYSSPPADVKEAMIYLACEQILGFVGARTGGGSLGVHAYNRNFGNRGKYQDIRNDLARQAHSVLSKYITRIVG